MNVHIIEAEIIRTSGDHCTGTKQSLRFITVRKINVSAKFAKDCDKNMSVILKHSLSFSLLLTWKSPVNNLQLKRPKPVSQNTKVVRHIRKIEMFAFSELFTD